MKLLYQAYSLSSYLPILVLLLQTLHQSGATPIADSKDTDVVSSLVPSTKSGFAAISPPEHFVNESAIPDVFLQKRAIDCSGLVQHFFCCFTCCLSKTKTTDIRAQLPIELEEQGDAVCLDNGQLPSLAELRAVIVEHNAVATKTNIFYTRNLSIAGGVIAAARLWLDTFTKGRCPSSNTVWFEEIATEDYMNAIYSAIGKYAEEYRGSGYDSFQQLRRFQKLFSQAYAEEAQGDVWVFMPEDAGNSDGSNFPKDNTWRQWEYPALTRNPNVKSIIRADPAKDGEGRFISDKSEIVWKQGDKSSNNEPLGTNWGDAGI